MAIIPRAISPVFLKMLSQYPVVTLTGPRQCGKTTLAKYLLPGWNYVNMESPSARREFEDDPEGFMMRYSAPCIFDEVQNVPELPSQIQVAVDESGKVGQYVLTGSYQAALRRSVAQSLAGRTAILRLLPLSIAELKAAGIEMTRDELLLRGLMPRLFGTEITDIDPYGYYDSYYQTYVERDVLSILSLRSLGAFDKFLRLLAGRVGQEVSLASLSNDIGVSRTTLAEWLSILIACYVIYPLESYSNNPGKRVIKTPKLYFTEPGLAAYLLKIHRPEHVETHPLIGHLFENLVVSEILKGKYNTASPADLYFYRDKSKLEVDLLLDRGNSLTPIEIKSAYTPNGKFSDNISTFRKHFPTADKGAVIYSGDTHPGGPQHVDWYNFADSARLLQS